MSHGGGSSSSTHDDTAIAGVLEEPDLDGVKAEDRTLVKDVISLLSTLQHPAQLCKGWNVNLIGTTHYEVNGLIDTKKPGEWEVFLEDFELLRRIDPLRVQSVSVRATGSAAQLRVKILSRTESVVVTEYDIIRVQKRRRWLF